MQALRWIGLILALLVLIAAAVIGGLWLGHQAAPAPTPTVTPTPTPTASAHAPGTYSWQELQAGDCLSEFTSAWKDTFTVVDCTQDHNAQLLVRANLPDVPLEYPGEKALSAQVAKLCAAKEIYDASAADQYPTLIVTSTFPMSAQEWQSSPEYSCFISARKPTVLSTSLMPGAVNPTPTPTHSPSPVPTASATPAA